MNLALWMFVNDGAICDVCPCVVAGDKDVYHTQSKDGKYVYAFLTPFTNDDPKGGTQRGRSVRKEVLLKELKATPSVIIRARLKPVDKIAISPGRMEVG